MYNVSSNEYILNKIERNDETLTSRSLGINNIGDEGNKALAEALGSRVI
ncbi:protein of unknown function [Legionella fallonii LLAP-10]|uniref:Uncharacterized protein n=1 Tax=Legionella fallonii LLAP-10 TaxID=1212491 RepID=A0A098G357_9GAMM|nr:protein of unknown function [Legionella fallonii LLAP-10]